MSAPYLHLSKFPISLNIEWIPVSPWLGPSWCPKVGCTVLLLAFKSYTKCKYTVMNALRAWSRWPSFSEGAAHHVSGSHCHLSRGDTVTGGLAGGLSAASWPLEGQKAKISWIWVETAFSRRARRSRSEFLGLKAKSAWMRSGNVCSTRWWWGISC